MPLDLAKIKSDAEIIASRCDMLLMTLPVRDVLGMLAEIQRLKGGRSKKERELEQELEVWHHGPFCWTCGDTGDVHDITGEWRGECNCLSAQLINANRERDQLKAENEALRKDAERYRGVRRVANRQGFTNEQFDQQTDYRVASFDAAMSKEKA